MKTHKCWHCGKEKLLTVENFKRALKNNPFSVTLATGFIYRCTQCTIDAIPLNINLLTGNKKCSRCCLVLPIKAFNTEKYKVRSMCQHCEHEDARLRRSTLRYKITRTLYFKTDSYKIKKRNQNKKYNNKLTDCTVIGRLSKNNKTMYRIIKSNPDLIQAKREQIKLHREIKLNEKKKKER